MAYTEFYVQPTGSNLNAGSTNTDAATLTYASGSWVASTGVFTVASGDPIANGVNVGDFASVYPDGSTVGVFVGRVTARTTTTITVSLTAKSGTAPVDGTSNRTVKIGGAWQGPSGTIAFPFNFVAGTLADASGNAPRVNMKSGTYAVTAAMTHAAAGPVRFEGYTTSIGDGGRATIDGGTVGSGYLLLSTSGSTATSFINLIFQNNGGSGTNHLINAGGQYTRWHRCVFNSARQSLISAGGTGSNIIDECEFYNANQNNSTLQAALIINGSASVNRCIFHDNPNLGNLTAGIFYGATVNQVLIVTDCVFDSNPGKGLRVNSVTAAVTIWNCDFYNNGDGIDFTGGAGAVNALIENCNFIANTGYGINKSGAVTVMGVVRNCGFGSGTMANVSGDIASLNSTNIIGSVNYPANSSPWIDPVNGDFRIDLDEAKGTGRGAFTQTAPSYAGTVAYPDIGAVQHQETGGTVFNPLAQTIIRAA